MSSWSSRDEKSAPNGGRLHSMSGGRVKRNAVIDRSYRFNSRSCTKQPVSFSRLGEHVDLRFILRNQNVLMKVRKTAVQLELSAVAIVSSRRGEAFDKHLGIDQPVFVFIGELRLAANHNEIGIKLRRRGDPKTFQETRQADAQSHRDQSVVKLRVFDWENLSIAILALHLSRPVKLQTAWLLSQSQHLDRSRVCSPYSPKSWASIGTSAVPRLGQMRRVTARGAGSRSGALRDVRTAAPSLAFRTLSETYTNEYLEVKR